MNFIAQLFICESILLVWFILSRNRHGKEPVGVLWLAFGFGLVALVASAIIEAIFLPDSLGMVLLSEQGLLNTSLTIGVIEELTKFLPLAIFIYKKSYFSEHNDGILYFALAGIGFGLPENLMYASSGGLGAGVIRLFMTPFFHAATTAIVGYYLAKMKLKKGTVAGVIVALIAMVLVHGAYDYGLLGHIHSFVFLSIAITITLTASLFIFIGIAKKEDEKLEIGK